jgi:signal transduction histidine kinase
VRSLKRRLIAWLIGLLTVVGLGAGGVSYWLARNDANALLDEQLRQIASHVGAVRAAPAAPRPESEEARENDFVVQVWDAGGALRSVSRPGFALPRHRATGFSQGFIGHQPWRVYTLNEPGRTVQVSQWIEVRREIAASAAMRAMLSVIVLIPLAWVLVIVAIGRILRPLDAVTKAASQRGAADLDPLPVEALPTELVPLVRAMNELLARLRDAIDAQRDFLSDAAHALRTPLAALQLQLENLSASRDQDDLEARIGEMRRGLGRASRLVGQLLGMAHFEAEAAQDGRVGVALGAIAKDAIAGLIPLAEDRGIDLGMVRDEAAVVMAKPSDIRMLVDNLIDNAVRYTPSGGRVDVGVSQQDGEPAISVVDSGPGIAPELLPRVFDRFFRVAGQDIEGSGIGLSIVKAIAEREGARVELANRREGGLVATVTFSRAV